MSSLFSRISAKGTIKIAHHLLPRFLSRKDSDFADLKIVLNKNVCQFSTFP